MAISATSSSRWASSVWCRCSRCRCCAVWRQRRRRPPRPRAGSLHEAPGALYTLVVMVTPARRSWDALLRLLERDERVYAVLLAVVLVGGLATLGLAPLRARHRVDIYSLVVWFAAYKLGILALVTVSPRATRSIFIGALGVDMLLVFALMYLTGGGDSPFVNMFYPLVAVNAYYFGRWVGLLLTAAAGLLYWLAAWLAPPGAALPGL